MDAQTDILFAPLELRNVTLPNRLVRAATYEGWGDEDGVPQPGLADHYRELARGGVGTILTGFAFTSQAGRAMQPGQCGIDTDARIGPWRQIVAHVRRAAPDVKLFMQLAHAGRQTRREATGLRVVGASSRKCRYFRQRVTALDEEGIQAVIGEFAAAARRAKEVGFDGVQVHAAHGYLIHQFLSPWTNTRADRWADRPLFLESVVRAVRHGCGEGFPILVKLSAADDNTPGVRLDDTIRTVQRLEPLAVDAVEISYGTMEYAMNIFRGACPIEVVFQVNPLFRRVPRLVRRLWRIFFLNQYLKRFIPFMEDYNVEAAARIRRAANVPVIAVGGIRSLEGMLACLTTYGLEAVSLCRPLICEPDLPLKIRAGEFERSRCTNCNLCAIHCDGRQPLRCYRNKHQRKRAACEERRRTKRQPTKSLFQ